MERKRRHFFSERTKKKKGFIFRLFLSIKVLYNILATFSGMKVMSEYTSSHSQADYKIPYLAILQRIPQKWP